MEFIKKNYKYYLCFVIFFVGLLFFGYNNADNIWNYGMAHAIHIGEIPYKDFNIIATPLYAFYMSFFLLFWDQYLMFLLAQSLLGTICFSYIDKMIGKKVFFLIPAMGLCLFQIFFPNYNFLVFTLLIILIYYDKEDSDDYLIGFLLGLLVLTKHTIGGVVVLCSLISTRSLSRSIKRISGMMGPGIVFLLYLLLTGSFSSFWNLSVMGLFDFGGHNNYTSPWFLGFSIIILLYAIWNIWKNPKDASHYYLLGSVSFIIPLVDMFHFQYLILMAVFHFVLHRKNISKYGWSFGIVLTIFFLLVTVRYHLESYQTGHFSSLPHFVGYFMNKEGEKNVQLVLKDYQEKENAYMFAYPNMFYDIASDHSITYLDIPLYGNFGYDGVSTMIKKIDDMHDVYFYVQNHNNPQYCVEIYEYIRENGKKSYELGGFEVYYKE